MDEVVISGGASRFLEPDLEKHFNCEHKYEYERVNGSYSNYAYFRTGEYRSDDPNKHFTTMIWGAGFVSEIKDILALDSKFEAENSLSYRLVDAYGLFDLLISKNLKRAKKASSKGKKQESIAS